MNTGHLPPMLRAYRRNWGLSLREMADLLGFESPAHVSRIEQGKRIPSTETALACTALFGVPVRELFPQLSGEIEERLIERATRLHLGLIQTSTQVGARKRELLDRALSRSHEEGNFAHV